MVNYEQLVVRRNALRWLRNLEQFGVLQFDDDGTASVNRSNQSAA